MPMPQNMQITVTFSGFSAIMRATLYRLSLRPCLPMHAPIHSPHRRPGRRPGRRPQRDTLARRMARHTPILELSARLTVNGLLTVASLSALSHLVPYLQAQSDRLEQVNQAVDEATTTNAKVRTEFDRYFDPVQASRLIQEYSGYRSPQERHIVWTEIPR